MAREITKDVVDRLFEEKKSREEMLHAINTTIEIFQGACKHDWRLIATGHNNNHEECTICRKQREV